MLSKFVRPKPNKTLIRFLAPVNNILCLKGIPALRDVPILNRIPGVRGICSVRHIDFPQADQNRLAAVCGKGKIAFITPNHPEFFTDWMLDKYITSLSCPMAANWATHGVVNGLGRAMQKFWLANNLIAQIPGNPEPSRQYSLEWALKGHGVLLHPEGAVGWHANYIAPLFPGAIEMARQALAQQPSHQAYVAPVVWKLVFTGDVTARLHRECGYVENKLGIDRETRGDIAARVFHLYQVLLRRDEVKWQTPVNEILTFRKRQLALIKKLNAKLSETLNNTDNADNAYVAQDGESLLRGSRRWLRENRNSPQRALVRDLVETIARHESLGDYAFVNKTTSQEELAEHIKRLRRDYCKGTLTDTLNAFIPQAAGLRTAHIRVPEPFALHSERDANLAPDQLQARMQAGLDDLNDQIEARDWFISFGNPFHN